jgi:hypothetical protein
MGPEAAIQKAIFEWLCYSGYFAIRINTGAVVSEYKGRTRMIRYGILGAGDILAMIPCCDYDRGFIPLWLEVKSPVGRQSPHQKSFEKDVISRGHRYAVVRSIEEVQAIVKEIA